MNEEFDAKKLFDDATKNTLKKGYDSLKNIMFDVFTNNAYLQDDENIALSKDMISSNTGMRYDNLIELWFRQWKLTQGKK